jgi:dihydroneopterin aldolase
VSLAVELYGLELYGHHGATEEEQRNGQRFLFDVWLEVPGRAASDRLEDTVDYRAVVACVRNVSEERRYELLEGLAAAIADAIRDRFTVQRVKVRVRKPDVKLDAPVEYSAASCEW